MSPALFKDENSTVASGFVAQASKLHDQSTEQKTVESMANSIVMGSFHDKDDRKKDKEEVPIKSMLDSIASTAKTFVEQLNKDEQKNAIGY